jgi:uncharacterized protein YdbL (DUF1318 family)
MTEYHWTPANQRKFLEALSETGSVETACKDVDMSRRAAYNLRNRREGRAFRIGWDAARMLARCAVADTLMDMALHGQTSQSMFDPRDGITTRLHHNVHLGLALLSRLDRQADAVAVSEDALIVQEVAQDFGIFLDLIEKGKADNAMVYFSGVAGVTREAEIQCELASVSADFEVQTDAELEAETHAIEAADAVAPKNTLASELIAQLEAHRAYNERHKGQYFERITPEQAMAELEAAE